MNARKLVPDVLLIGAPKAGTSALHSALSQHPQVFASPVKEPKYFMCADAPPPAYCGPGDAHSQQEWVWRRQDYEQLFAAAPAGSVRLESTPFYLYLPQARRRIAEELPDAKLIALIRDPIDRAHSNWMHLWSDGLEPEADFEVACTQEHHRINAGRAPFWHYLGLGRYGEQFADLFSRFDRNRVLILRYRQLVDEPDTTMDTVARFLGLAEGVIQSVPHDNLRGFVESGPRSRVLGPTIRLGARVGAYAPPAVWRTASRPLTTALQWGAPTHRPTLEPAARNRLLGGLVDDIDRLEDLLGESFSDWRSATGRGSFTSRVGPAKS